MENTTNAKWDNFFLGFSIIATLSGIYLIIQQDYLIGAGGAATGLLLTYMNISKRKALENKK